MSVVDLGRSLEPWKPDLDFHTVYVKALAQWLPLRPS